MARPRIHVPPERIREDRARLEREEVAHLSRVLRLGPGDAVEVFDGTGALWDATVESLEGESPSLRLGARREGAPPPPPFVLLQGLAKGEKLEWVVQKAVELGVTEVRPVACARSVVRLDEKKARSRTQRWQKVAVEAARQCGRADVPEVHPPAALEAVLAEVGRRAGLLKLVAWEEERARGLGGLLAEHPDAGGHALLVGPEGGLTSVEVESARAAGFETVHLGRRILRTETVALAVLAAVRFAGGELG